MTAGDWAMLLGLSVLWGGSFFFAAVALKELVHAMKITCVSETVPVVI